MHRYRLYVDESGDHTYRRMDDLNNRFLSLTGIMVEQSVYTHDFQPKLEKLKQEHFGYDPDDLVILHREDIKASRGHFKVFLNKKLRENFDRDLLSFLDSQRYIIMTVTIDKKRHLANYGRRAYHPYHYCILALLERYCGLLNFRSGVGDVLAEARGKSEDKALAIAYTDIFNMAKGSPRDVQFFQSTLTSKEIKFRRKEANVAGLQIADLLAWPSKQSMLADSALTAAPGGEFWERLNRIMNDKYNRQVYQDRIAGYGKIWL